MRTVSLGRSGLKVTKIGFGGIPLQRLSMERAVELVRFALDRGINWVDTGHRYGHSEEVMGRAFKGLDRGKLFLFTKANARTKTAMEEQIALSFQRLEMDYVDLYQFHCVPDEETWKRMKADGTMEVLLRYKEMGKIRHIGASAHKKEAALMLAEDPLIEVLQWPFNFMVEDYSREVIEKCRRHGVGFISMKPFGGGLMGDARACVRFQHLYPEAALDPGFEQVHEVEEVLALAEEALTPTAEDRANMDRISRELGSEFCRRCGYCSPCPNKVNIVDLMTMDSAIKRFPLEKLIHGDPAKAAASVESCTRCGECETKCPFELKIMDRIRKSADVLAGYVKKEGAARA